MMAPGEVGPGWMPRRVVSRADRGALGDARSPSWDRIPEIALHVRFRQRATPVDATTNDRAGCWSAVCISYGRRRSTTECASIAKGWVGRGCDRDNAGGYLGLPS